MEEKEASAPDAVSPAEREAEPLPSPQEPAADMLAPRGASPSELDALRVSIKVSPRSQPGPPVPRASAPPPPLAQSIIHRGEIDRIIDEGRALLETDVKAAHEIFTRAWRRNLNDPRVLSNFGLTLVLVEGDRQRGIRFCEEALRRGLQTTETLVNLAKALVVTRNKEQAVRALRKAMDLAPDDPRVGEEFAALGLRRRPPIPFLPRSFFLNKWIGRLTWRWTRRYHLDPLHR
jgi:tetratricopeptide (TPR) repeat protein